MPKKRYQRWNFRATVLVLWCLLSSFVVESIVFGFSVLPGVLFWEWHLHWQHTGPSWTRLVLLSMAFIPAYLLFAFSLVILSALSTRVLGWQAPVDCEMPISNPGWPLINWVRYTISMHLVRIFAGPVFRSTPLWTLYMKLNGAKLGRRVFVNSLWVTDHNLLEFGNDVVIGSEVHLSGHTVERGMVKTAKVRLGDGVMVGVGAIVDIGVEAGPRCQIGAMSLVPKFSKLEADQTYAGIPVHRLEPHTKREAL
jgi:acetyltransferase-like isoleucine patch superfamily enzyme